MVLSPILGMSPEEQQIVSELGLDDTTIAALRQMTFQEAAKRLDEIKAEAKKRFKQLQFKYHPDRNPNCQEASTRRFKLLPAALEFIERLIIQPKETIYAQTVDGSPGRPLGRPGRRQVRFSYFPGAHPFGGTVTAVTDVVTGASKGRYDATQVVIIRPTTR